MTHFRLSPSLFRVWIQDGARLIKLRSLATSLSKIRLPCRLAKKMSSQVCKTGSWSSCGGWGARWTLLVFENHAAFSVFISDMIKTKNRNLSMNEVKNLGYDRWLICLQPLQESGLRCFSFPSYLQKCVTQIYRALYGDAMFVSFWDEGHKHGGRKVAETSVTELCYWNEKVLL